MVIETYAMESSVLRAQELADRNGEAAAANDAAMTRVYMTGAMEGIESATRMVLAAASEGDMFRSQIAILAVCLSMNRSILLHCGRRLRRRSSKPGNTRWCSSLRCRSAKTRPAYEASNGANCHPNSATAGYLQSFSTYIRDAEAAMEESLRDGPFLWSDAP
jgi:hypothetical protein